MMYHHTLRQQMSWDRGYTYVSCYKRINCEGLRVNVICTRCEMEKTSRQFRLGHPVVLCMGDYVISAAILDQGPLLVVISYPRYVPAYALQKRVILSLS